MGVSYCIGVIVELEEPVVSTQEAARRDSGMPGGGDALLRGALGCSRPARYMNSATPTASESPLETADQGGWLLQPQILRIGITPFAVAAAGYRDGRSCRDLICCIAVRYVRPEERSLLPFRDADRPAETIPNCPSGVARRGDDDPDSAALAG